MKKADPVLLVSSFFPVFSCHLIWLRPLPACKVQARSLLTRRAEAQQNAIKRGKVKWTVT